VGQEFQIHLLHRCYGGKHPNVFCPTEQPHAEFQSIEDINNYLLQHK